MARVRPVWAALAAAFALFLTAFSTVALQGVSQTSAPAPTAAQVAPFTGDWVATVAMGGTQSTSIVSVKLDGGKLTATVTPEGQAPIAVRDVAIANGSLVLRYSIDYQGNPISTVMTLTPDTTAGPTGPLGNATQRVQMAVMDGQYEMSGMAAKQAPGAPLPQRGGGGGFGGGRGPQTNENTDFAPKAPYLPRSPEEEARGFMLPPGYRMELVAADPEVISPSLVEFDGNGRMYVGEMISYMMDAGATREHDPISRISRWESTKGDGKYDKRTIFADHLVAPRMILPLQDGVILTSETDSDEIIRLSDTNGDGVADKREVVFTGIGQSGDANIEHQKAGLVWNMDNWIYTTYNPFRIRWTPSGFLREPTGPNGGQWGLATDDDGKPWFVDAGGERGPMNFQFPIHYGSFTPCQVAPQRGRAGAPAPPPLAPNKNCPPGMEGGFEKDFAVVWPSPGIGDMQGGIMRTRMPAQNLNHFTATTGPAIFRGDALPADLKGHLLFTEPVGRLIRRAAVDNIEGLTLLRNVYPQAEFLTSVDQLFRPVNISNAPDGTLYIADMYHGIIQELQWSGPGSYLRAKIEQYQLDKVAQHGRIWRLRYDGRPAVAATDTNIGQPAIPAIAPKFAAPRMYGETPAELVAHLSHPNGWWRDMAQRLLILRQDKSVVPALQQIARSSDNLLARFHAIWTLEGLGALDAALVRDAMEDKSPRLRVQALRASETLYKNGDKTFADDYRRLSKDAEPGVAIQAMLSASLFKLKDLPDLVKAAQAGNPAKGVAIVGERLLSPPAAFGGGGRRGTLTPAEEKRLQQGSDVFGAVCFACHGTDALGAPLEGAAPGTMMAPALAGSPRVQGHRDYVIKVLLRGLTGPLDGKTYRDVMVPMDNTDEWVAGVASYVRTSFGNSGDLVTPADVARVRAEIAGRKTPWTAPEIESSLPRVLDSQQFKLSASHGNETAAAAATLRGWSSGAAQAPGMWFQIELPQPALVSELQFDSTGGGGRGNRGAAAPLPAPGPAGRGVIAPAPAPAAGYPRAYSVQVSMDGKKWSKPVAQGMGEGAHSTIAFAPVRAQFVRITQTDNIADAPPWSIRNLRVFETSPSAGTR
jgi:mono/diheme cytochrome c family protein/glucose/arabinose dehydrogenase